MTDKKPELLKNKVRKHWDSQACGTDKSDKEKFSKTYFDEIENYRYTVEPEIFSFAQFTRHHGQKMLEVGMGAGTDFLQWVRAGTQAHGVDLTPESIQHIEQRLSLYNLKAQEVQVADCENIPYPDNNFDLVYSWGVIHHTPDTPKALAEIVRVMRPGGTGKIMIYNRYSLVAFFLWIRKALFKARPWKSLSWCLYHFMESKGTKAYTRKEAQKMLKKLPVENIQIQTVLTYYDKLGYSNKLFQFCARLLAVICGGNRVGWFMTIKFTKKA